MAAGSDDEEHFQKKDRARLARDKLRLNPVVLGKVLVNIGFYALSACPHSEQDELANCAACLKSDGVLAYVSWGHSMLSLKKQAGVAFGQPDI